MSETSKIKEWGIINDKMSYTHLITFKVGPKWSRCHSLSNDWHVAKACGLLASGSFDV